MKYLILSACIVLSFSCAGQSSEERLDYYLKPTTSVPRYVAVTEQKDTGWYREIFYWPEKTLAMTGWFLDADGKNAHGPQVWYHRTRYPKSSGTYSHGKKQGPWIEYSKDGKVTDSSNYSAGNKRGISYSYHKTGFIADSTFFDNDGNGTQVSWYDDGAPLSAGAWVSDTLKSKRWVYYDRSGRLLATEDYEMGELVKSVCYDSTGVALQQPCIEKEAVFSDGETAWGKYLSRNLRPNAPIKGGAPEGIYTVAVRFVVRTDGSLADFEPVTEFGYGMEAEVVRMLKKSPKWIPAIQRGRNVNAYRIQPITFQVSSE